MSRVLDRTSGTLVEPFVRRRPPPGAGVDLNSCRSPSCAAHGVASDPSSGQVASRHSRRMSREVWLREKGTRSPVSALLAGRPPGPRTTSRSWKGTSGSASCARPTRVPQLAGPRVARTRISPSETIPGSAGSSGRRTAAIRGGGAGIVGRPSRLESRHDGTSGPTRTVWFWTCSATTCRWPRSRRSPVRRTGTSIAASISTTRGPAVSEPGEETSRGSTSRRWDLGSPRTVRP